MEKNEETTATQKKNVVNKNGLEFVIVEIPRTKKKYRVGTLQNSQLDALAKLLIGKDGQDSSAMDEVLQDSKLACKAAAIYVTRGYFKLKLKYWFLWRWFYYIKQYDNTQLQPILSAGVGSTPYIDFLKTMSLLSNQRTTQMRMTAREAEIIMRELATKTIDSSEEAKNGEVAKE